MSAPTFRVEKLRERIEDNLSPSEAAEFLVSEMLRRPDGALYAKWDATNDEAIWYYSSDYKAIFELPETREKILRQTIRGIFRSVIFRIGHHAAEEQGFVPLSGYYFLEHNQNGQVNRRKIMIHADFFPEFGLWIKATFLTVQDK